MYQSYQFSMLSCHAISVLDQSLELVVLCESDDLQHSAELGENLRRTDSIITSVMMITHLGLSIQLHRRTNKSNMFCLHNNKSTTKICFYLVEYIQGNRVEEVFHYDSKHGALRRCSSHGACICRDSHATHTTSMQCIDCLQSCLGTLGDKVKRNILNTDGENSTWARFLVRGISCGWPENSIILSTLQKQFWLQ